MSAGGASFPEALSGIGALDASDARIVFLRPDRRYDDASLSRMVIRVDERIVGRLV